jgi:hypothetical protein
VTATIAAPAEIRTVYFDQSKSKWALIIKRGNIVKFHFLPKTVRDREAAEAAAADLS